MYFDKSNKHNFKRSVDIVLFMQHYFEIKVKFKAVARDTGLYL